MKAQRQAVFGGGTQDTAALVGGEDARLAEDVAESGDLLARNGRQLLPNDMGDVCLGPLELVAELARNSMRAQESGHKLYGAIAIQAADGIELAQLRRHVQPVAGLGLGRCGAVGEHLSEAAARPGQQVLVRGRARQRHGRKNPPTRLQNLEIASATQAQLPFRLARSGEDEVGVGIDESRRHEPTGRVQTGERFERVSGSLDLADDFRPRPGGNDAATPDGHGK